MTTRWLNPVHLASPPDEEKKEELRKHFTNLCERSGWTIKSVVFGEDVLTAYNWGHVSDPQLWAGCVIDS